MANRLRVFREGAGISQAKLASMANTSQQQIDKLEKKDGGIPLVWAERLAPHLDRDVEELMFAPKSVPVVGRVGAGAKVYPFDDHAMGDGLYEVKCPPGMDPKKTVAVEVEGDSMWPIDDGWVLFYSRVNEAPPSEVVGKMCVVKVANDGPTYVKRVARGSKPGLFTLRSTNAQDIEDVALDWASPVKTYMAPDQAKAA